MHLIFVSSPPQIFNIKDDPVKMKLFFLSVVFNFITESKLIIK